MSFISFVLLNSLTYTGLLAGQVPIPDHTPMSLSQIEKLGKKVKSNVVYITAKDETAKDSLISDQLRDGFGVVVNDNTVAIMALLVQNTHQIEIHGPSGLKAKGRVTRVDAKSRIALIRSEKSLKGIGLEAPDWRLTEKLTVGLPAFALASTIGQPELREFFVTHTGTEIGFEGTPRLNHPLLHGMPVFDSQARCLGFARAGLWDVDKGLLIPAKTIQDVSESESLNRQSPKR